jgi:hypothetical protein
MSKNFDSIKTRKGFNKKGNEIKKKGKFLKSRPIDLLLAGGSS